MHCSSCGGGVVPSQVCSPDMWEQRFLETMVYALVWSLPFLEYSRRVLVCRGPFLEINPGLSCFCSCLDSAPSKLQKNPSLKMLHKVASPPHPQLWADQDSASSTQWAGPWWVGGADWDSTCWLSVLTSHPLEDMALPLKSVSAMDTPAESLTHRSAAKHSNHQACPSSAKWPHESQLLKEHMSPNGDQRSCRCLRGCHNP